jgi:hypothetical protein
MPAFKALCRHKLALLAILLILTPALAKAANLNDLLGKKELDETERQETIQRIENIQDKLKLLQEKLRVLESRKAEQDAAQQTSGDGSGAISAPAGQVNWLPVDETTTTPGDFGMYTYLLFKGDVSNTSAIGVLEDFILTIETLPANHIPAGLANRFLVPVEKPQSLVKLARQPYDFQLNEAYLRRLELQEKLPDGPVLVSTSEPLDPVGSGRIPLFLAVSLGRQTPERTLALAKIWHNQESEALSDDTLPVAKLFWDVIDGAGPTQVTRYQQRILVTLPQQ